jgi:hypothetical protein
VLDGHEHVYERFARQTPGAVHSGDGIREFAVGTGEAETYEFGYRSRTARYVSPGGTACFASGSALLLTRGASSRRTTKSSTEAAPSPATSATCLGKIR